MTGPTPRSQPWRRVTGLALAAALAACSPAGKQEAPTGQVAAKVNGDDISVHQVNYLLSRSNVASTTQEAVQLARNGTLQRLVDQQLLVQKAQEEKVDRSPDVQMALDAARREVLAGAYLQHSTAGMPVATADDARAYFREHPQLFSDRRVFGFQELRFAAGADATAQSTLKGMVSAGRPIEAVARLLRDRGVAFAQESTRKASEQIPIELLTRLYALREGQGMVIENPEGVTVMYVLDYLQAPMGEDVAVPRIQKFLVNQRKAEALGDLIKRLRKDAQITYQADFAPAAPTADTASR